MKMQAKQQRLSRKYKLPSWSPSSTGRTHSCKEEKKQRWAVGPVTMTQNFWTLHRDPRRGLWQLRQKPTGKFCFSLKADEANKLMHTVIIYSLFRKTNRKTDKKSNQKNREEFKSTYLPLHRPLHAASVQSKSRTEIINDGTGQPVPECPLYGAQLMKHIYQIEMLMLLF